MRKFVNGAGADVTSATNAYLANTDKAQFVDLFLIGEQENPLSDFLTSWDTPLTWSIYQRSFINTVVVDRSEVSSQIDLKVDKFTFQWAPKLTAFGTTVATANRYQRVKNGFYDNQTFKFFRGVLNPAVPGDLNTYGACTLFGGRIATARVARGQLEFDVNSFLDVADQLVPPNVIELNNTLAQFAGATPVVADGETRIPQFTVVAPSTTGNILAICNSPTANKIYSDNKFRYGYLVFNAGSANEGRWSPIAASGKFKTGGVTYNQFLVLAGFDFTPTPGDTFYVSTQPPINQQDAVALFEYFGFPYVPQPESAM